MSSLGMGNLGGLGSIAGMNDSMRRMSGMAVGLPGMGGMSMGMP